MKKFPIKFKPFTNIMFIVTAGVLFFIIYFNFKRMFDMGFDKMFDTGFDTRVLWLHIILAVLGLILFAVLLSIAFFSKYKVSDTRIKIYLGPFVFKIEINKIDKIINYEKNSETFIVYTKNESKKAHLIFVEHHRQRELIELLKNINRNIIYIIETEKIEDENNK